MPSCEISWWKNVSEKEKNFFTLIYNISSLSKMAGKPFSWRQDEYEFKVKYLENLVFEKRCYFEWYVK